MGRTLNTCILVMDLGTSNLKVVAFDTAYNTVAECSHSINMIRDERLAEQCADDWMYALTHCLKTVCPVIKKDGYHVAGMGFTGHMSAPVFVDKNKKVIAPIQTLADQRCINQVAHISESQQNAITNATGNIPAPYFTLPKIMWALQNDPTLGANTQAVLTPKDYIRLQLGGGFYSDCSDCCNTLLLDYENVDWHHDNVKNMGIAKNILPMLKKSTDLDGVLSPAWANKLDLPNNIPLVVGASDMATALISCQSDKMDTIGVTMGTSLTVTKGCHALIGDLQGKVTFHMSARNSLFALGSHFNGGSCIDWFHSILLGGKTLSQDQKHQNLITLIEQAMSVPVTENAPLFMPHLLGSGSPDFDPNACGVFSHLNAGHTHIDMIRAVLEGVTMDACKTVALLQQYTDATCHIMAGGGGVYLQGWAQMLADISGLTIRVPKNPQSSALGCAIITYESLGITAQQQNDYKQYAPHKKDHKLYKKRIVKVTEKK